jgi:hypothetical protein
MKDAIFWDITLCSPLSQLTFERKHSSVFCLLHAVFLLGLLFNPEDGDGMSTDFQQTTQHYIPEDMNPHKHHCENLQPCIFQVPSIQNPHNGVNYKHVQTC